MTAAFRQTWLRRAGTVVAIVALVVTIGTSVHAQCGNFNFGNRVGGVSIDAAGVLVAAPEVVKADVDELRKDFKPTPTALAKMVGMRMISLKRIESAIADASKTGGEVPPEIRFLAGIQRIQFVFVYPEQNDIVLAGPGEGWRLNEEGTFVGVTTGRPVMFLDDLLVALRATIGERRTISCSIDPTEEGRQRFAQFMGRLKTTSDWNAASAKAAGEAMGMQAITVSGVEPTSHIARVMVAADFRMKQIAMDIEPSPVAGMKSYLAALASSKVKAVNMTPRWWLACNYDAVHKSEDGLAWELRGPGVKCMTEEEFVDTDGKLKKAGGVNPVAQAYAKLFTEKYDELSTRETIFGDLRNVMDLCVIAALIEKNDLITKANANFPLLLPGEKSYQPSPYVHVPKFVATQISSVKRPKELVIAASGGVDVNAFEVVSKTENSAMLPNLRMKADGASQAAFWWE